MFGYGWGEDVPQVPCGIRGKLLGIGFLPTVWILKLDPRSSGPTASRLFAEPHRPLSFRS